MIDAAEELVLATTEDVVCSLADAAVFAWDDTLIVSPEDVLSALVLLPGFVVLPPLVVLWESVVLSVEVGESDVVPEESVVVPEADSVEKDTAVVEESDTMMGTVVEEEVSSELVDEVTVAFVVCLFLNSAFTATSCLAISTSRVAKVGFSSWICSMARWSASKIPSWYCGLRWPCNAACRDSEGKWSSSCLNSLVSIKSRPDSLGSGWLCATAMYTDWRATNKRDLIEGMTTDGRSIPVCRPCF